MRVSNPVVCRASMMAYTAVAVAISAVYLYRNWGVHGDYVAVRAQMLAHPDGDGGLEGMAFTESGGAEYLLVGLYFAFHTLVLGLLMAGRQRNIVMGVACALLLACSMIYVLFYGCLVMQTRLEQYQSLTSNGSVPLRKPAPPAPYQLTADDVDRTIVSGSAGVESVVEAAPRSQQASEGSCQSDTQFDGTLSYANLGWTVLETLVDVLAAIVAGPEEVDPDAAVVQRYHQDGSPIDATTPFASLRRTSLLVMSVVGVALSIWGVTTFDLSPQGVARASNPGLTASALSQLSSSSEKKSERSEERRRARVAAAMQEAAPTTSAGKGAKKNQ